GPGRAGRVRAAGRDCTDVAREQGRAVTSAAPLRRELDGPLRDALAGASDGDLVGPVATPEGFALAVIERRLPAEPDATTRQDIQDALFARWLAEQLEQATLNLDFPEAAG